METRITKLLGIKYPVIQGGMAWVATHELASAVSNAGGLGIIGAGGAPASWVKEQIVAAKKETDKPFGVNLMLMNPEADEIAKIIAEEKVKVVTTGAGNPAKYMDMWKEAGVIVIPVVASVALAKLMERGGASAVIAEGMESGGHIGAQTTMTLVPQVVDAVSIPVIAAGGIADNRGFNAAFALGAEAVQMGTRFVTAKESIVHENYKQKVIKAKADELIEQSGLKMKYMVGTMIETPRAAVTAGDVAKEAEFFSFGTNDLTQMTFGFSRDDAGKFLGAYYDKKIYENDPFARLDQVGVGKLVKMAATLGRQTRPDLHLGICGEHGGDPSSVEFCHKVGLDYVSCSPFRVPIARLAAAQAAIRDQH